MSDLKDALSATDPKRVGGILTSTETSVVDLLEETLPEALAGGLQATQTIVRMWSRLVDDSVAAAHLSAEERVLSTLRAAVLGVPFSPYVTSFGPGTGAAVECVAVVRRAFAGLRPLPVTAAGLSEMAIGAELDRFRRYADLALRQMRPPLDQIQHDLALSSTELASMFGVSRQAVEQWRSRGLPPDRSRQMGDLLAVVEILTRKLKPGRLPLVARRPAAAWGGKSLLEMLTTGKARQVADQLESVFDWSTAA